MRNLGALAACLCTGFILCGTAAANLIVGINDDVEYEAASPAFFMPTMQADGLKINTLTMRWDDTQPTTIPSDVAAALATVIPRGAGRRRHRPARSVPAPLTGAHRRHALRAVDRSRPPAATRSKIQQFAAWTALVAQTFPTVHDFAVMNECNQPLFVNPQWMNDGLNQSAEICGRALAAVVRRAEGAEQRELRVGCGAFAARKRQAERAVERVDLAGQVPPGPRRMVHVVRRQDPSHRAAHGRSRLPSVPGPAVAAVRDGLSERERRERLEPHADLSGVLQRLQQVAAADDRPAEGRRPSGQPERDGHPDERAAGRPGTRASR